MIIGFHTILIKQKRWDRDIPSPQHKDLQNKILEIGFREGFVTEKEYQTKKKSKMGSFSLDVVWKITKLSDPKVAFEVELSGAIAKSICSLRTANTKWSCKGVLVSNAKGVSKARAMLEEEHPTLSDEIKIVEIEAITTLHKLIQDKWKIQDTIGYKTRPA